MTAMRSGRPLLRTQKSMQRPGKKIESIKLRCALGMVGKGKGRNVLV